MAPDAYLITSLVKTLRCLTCYVLTCYVLKRTILALQPQPRGVAPRVLLHLQSMAACRLLTAASLVMLWLWAADARPATETLQVRAPGASVP